MSTRWETRFRRVEGVAYRGAQAGLPTPSYDLLLPHEQVDRRLFVHLHGGGWRAGHRRMGSLPEAFAAHGVMTVSADYTLTTDAPYPRNLEDVFALLEHLRDRADELGFDRDAVVIGGSSSGAHLTALATTKGLAEDRLALVPAGVIGWYGPLDPVSRFNRLRYPAEAWPGSFWSQGMDRPREDKDLFRQFIGTSDFTTVTLAAALDADPRTHLEHVDPAVIPPFLLFVGSRDSDEIRYAQHSWHAALRSAGASAELLLVEGADHGDDHFTTPATLGAALGFLRA